jgi:Tol biopolymer transport system component
MRRLLGLIVAALAATLLAVGPAQATFPGKNGKIAFSSDRDSGKFEVWSINPDGSDPTELTSAPSTLAEPAWSPDGKRIAFAVCRGSDPVHGYCNEDIFVMNADGSEETRVTRDPAADRHPAWSPDGKKLVFSRHPAGPRSHLYIINPDGSGERQLTNGSDGDGEDYPTWASDGTLAFERGQDIYTMSLDGTHQTPITHLSGPNFAGAPNWSPDAKKIVFFFYGPRPFCGGDIFVMNRDGSDLRQLTFPPDGCINSGLYPVWSPDGTKIAYMAAASSAPGSPPYDLFPFNSAEIFVMNADGSQRTNVTNNRADERYPDWQPIPRPRRSDYKNANQFCKAEQAFWGDQFNQHYRNFGECVSGSR